MPHILIVDSNPDALYRDQAAQGRTGQREGVHYGNVLRAIEPTVRFDVIAPYDDPAPADLGGVDGVVFTGSGVSWSTDDPRAAPLAAVMRHAFAAGLPVFGSCNGMQLAASVLGGATGASPNGREDGMAMGIRLTPEGAVHPMLAGRRQGFAVPCVHRDEVRTLPQGAVLLATNDHSRVQAFAVETGGVRFWGVQYHPELAAADLAPWLSKNGRLPAETCAWLRDCAHDSQAAARLGTTPEEQTLPLRALELRNWLGQI